MKRFICLLLTPILVLVLYGCNNSPNISLNTDNIDTFDTNVSSSNSNALEETDGYPDENVTSASDFEYTLRQDGEFVITKYTGNDERVIIPEKIDGNVVTALGEASFAKSNIVSVTMPYTVKYISSRAFVNCEKLNDIQMSFSLITIGSRAFFNCSSLSNIDLSTP